MTTVIDHAIAIPTKQTNVWAVLSDLTQNTMWQADCDDVTFLTTMHDGRGTRWRNISPVGREYVIEITAWYDGLGYEYVIVDGVPYSENRGRIRLQEAPEGTVVQWTFSYEMSGLLAGLRNSMGTKRAVENDIIDSLRNLYNYIKHLRGDEAFDASEAKSLMREAPDVEARAKYQPRHPSSVNIDKVPDDITPQQATPPEAEPVAQSRPLEDDARYMPPADFKISEPPVAEDDTRPNPKTSQEMDSVPDTPQQDTVNEPDFLQGLPTAEQVSSASDVEEATPAEPAPKEPTSAEQPARETPEPTSSLWLDDKPTSEPTRADATIPEPPVDARDTGSVSVFDIFGLEKPSETQQMKALRQAQIERASDDIQAPAPPRRRVGLRAKLRAQQVNVRLPMADE